MTCERTSVEHLLSWLDRVENLFVLTGAGCSTDSGIPDYRDRYGQWKRKQPIQYREFVSDPGARRRYWARSMLGWPTVRDASPGAAHHALAALQRAGRVHKLVTQNVDGLHGRAGSTGVLDLHGNLDSVQCLECAEVVDRSRFQQQLTERNADWAHDDVTLAPDGDVDLDGVRYEDFDVPGCPRCQGVLKPTVVFFGESVPRPVVAHAFEHLHASDGLLVVGSSLMAFSGYRFVRESARAGQPAAVINLGRTRADDEVDLKVEAPCGEILAEVVERIV